jgi:hypothetical protein
MQRKKGLTGTTSRSLQNISIVGRSISSLPHEAIPASCCDHMPTPYNHALILRIVGRAQKDMTEEEVPIMRQYAANLRDAWEARVILRDLHKQSGMATCSGEVDCGQTLE